MEQSEHKLFGLISTITYSYFVFVSYVLIKDEK